MHATLSAVTHGANVQLRYAVRTLADEWAIPEGPVPESIPHSVAVHHLLSLLRRWSRLAGRPIFVAENLAVRWLAERPSVGIDPDACLLDPPPPEVSSLSSLCLWKPGHLPPPLCFEVVSENHPYKDYVSVHERYAAFGCRELVVFDPFLAGPKSHGGPVPLQVWRRNEIEVFERQYAGPGPAYSEILGAWLVADGRLLEVADDPKGERRFLTEEAFERAEKERERAEKERERAEKECERAEKERERAEKEEERSRRLELERRVRELEQRVGSSSKSSDR